MDTHSCALCFQFCLCFLPFKGFSYILSHFILMTWCMRAKKGAFMCAVLLQSCLALYNPMDCSLPGSSVHRILQARILEWVAMPSSREIFLTQESKPHLLGLLPWQVGSSPLAPLGKGDPCCPNSQKVLQLSRGWPRTQLSLPLDFLSRVAMTKTLVVGLLYKYMISFFTSMNYWMSYHF